MRELAAAALIAFLAAGCTSGGATSSPGKASATGTKAPAPAPSPTPDSEKPPTPEEQAAARKRAEAVAALAGKPLPEEDERPSAPPVIVVDPKTGVRLERIPKSNSVFLKDGEVHHRFALSRLGIPLVREDAEAYYVEAAPERKPGAKPEEQPSVAADLRGILEFPASEGEVVKPPVSPRRIRFEERSEGLPKSGFWRTNFDVADLDGDGKLEIVTPPPRLTPGGPRIFKAEGNGWKEIRPEIRDAGGARFGYGGVAVGDMDGDGKPDIVAIGHLAGLTILFNEGGLRFRAEERGLPAVMSGRALALGDLNGDGRLDIVAQSDESEYTKVRHEQELEKAGMKKPGAPSAARAGEYVPGVDIRYFLSRPDGTYEEGHSGLEDSCYGYSIALQAKPADGGAPFFVSSCRYSGRTQVLYSWDKAASSFVRSGLEVVERFGYHIGVATGTYQGKPAAYVSYFKSAPQNAVPPLNGYGVSVYYRDGDEWKNRRVVKVVQTPSWDLSAIAVGDLDGDGLDDVVLADDATSRLRIFFQTPQGGFEELATELEPVTRNRATSVRIADIDGDGRNDIVLMYEFRSSDRSKSGGLRVFLNRLP